MELEKYYNQEWKERETSLFIGWKSPFIEEPNVFQKSGIWRFA